jgi:hypothetical protein
MTWSMVVMDEGINNDVQIAAGKSTVYEYDYFWMTTDTDVGVSNTQGSRVFLSALAVSSAYDVMDLKVAIGVNTAPGSNLVYQALNDIIEMGQPNIGAINMSFTGQASEFAHQIKHLANLGILTVAAAGDAGSHAALESPSSPAALPYVIAVGSHDGSGNPSVFSQNGPGVDVLADGEHMPWLESHGTGMATPRVAATATHVQAIVQGLIGARLSVDGMIDALQQGGAGPLSNPDPADGATRYFLHDHAGSLDYAWSRHGGTDTKALEYVASYADLIGELGADPAAGRLHFEQQGSVEERAITFDGLDYIASHGDLIRAFGADAQQGAIHYITSGFRDGRAPDLFDEVQYLANYADLRAAFGDDGEAATAHFITAGYQEGRTDEPVAAAPLDPADATPAQAAAVGVDFLL